jgi:hypothetical protein
MSNPNSYAVWADAVAFVPSLDGDIVAENLFNIWIQTMPSFVDPSLAGNQTNILSLLLTLHFITIFYSGSKSVVFLPEDFVGTAGAIQGLVGEKVAIQYLKSAEMTVFQSDLSQTSYGQSFNTIVASLRAIIGIDGQGGLWEPL